MLDIKDIEDFTQIFGYLQTSNTRHPWILDILDTKDVLTADSLRKHISWMLDIKDIEDFTEILNYFQTSNTHNPWILDILDIKDLLTTDSRRNTSLGCWILRILRISQR